MKAGSSRFVVSHVRARNKAQRWGTEHLFLFTTLLVLYIAFRDAAYSEGDVSI
jgi:hypothetical protein